SPHGKNKPRPPPFSLSPSRKSPPHLLLSHAQSLSLSLSLPLSKFALPLSISHVHHLERRPPDPEADGDDPLSHERWSTRRTLGSSNKGSLEKLRNLEQGMISKHCSIDFNLQSEST